MKINPDEPAVQSHRKVERSPPKKKIPLRIALGMESVDGVIQENTAFPHAGKGTILR